jgi:hypothetical protein
MKTNNVYIINDSCHDYSKAEKFGKLTFLTKGKRNKLATARMFREFYDVLKWSGPEDHILLSGLTVMSVIACCVFVAKHKRINLLIYHTEGAKSYYKTRTIEFKED